mgnify:CR=1 FL=1
MLSYTRRKNPHEHNNPQFGADHRNHKKRFAAKKGFPGAYA